MAFDLSKITGAFNFGNLAHDDSGVVGVDIGSSSIKVVQLKHSGAGGAALETYGELQLGPYAKVEIGRATNLDTAHLSEALVDIVREASVTTKKAAFGISYASSFITVVSFPTADQGQLAAMVPIEARKHVPVPINEVMLDWFVIPDSRGKEGAGQQATRVLLAAIHNESLSKIRACAKNAALITGFVEIEAFSTIRSSVLEEDVTVVLLDLGAATTKLYVVQNGIVQKTHSITLGSQDMTLSLSKALELSVADAEELKRQVGLSEAGTDARIGQALNFTLERIVTEARRFIGAYESTAGVPVAKVILTGGGSLLKALPEYATSVLEKEVALADPFSKVEYPAFLEDTLKEAGPSFAVAVGVALRKLNEE